MNANFNYNPNEYPARLTIELAAKILGFKPHDMPFLIRGRLLKYLGKQKKSFVKYFARDYILALASNEAWLDRATTYMQTVWEGKTAARKFKRGSDENPPAAIDA